MATVDGWDVSYGIAETPGNGRHHVAAYVDGTKLVVEITDGAGGFMSQGSMAARIPLSVVRALSPAEQAEPEGHALCPGCGAWLHVTGWAPEEEG